MKNICHTLLGAVNSAKRKPTERERVFYQCYYNIYHHYHSRLSYVADTVFLKLYL